MESLQKKVKLALRNGFPRARVARLEGDTDGIIGVVVSPRFRGLKTPLRIRLIDQALTQALTEKEFAKVALIVPMIPEEAKARPDLIDPNGSRRNSN